MVFATGDTKQQAISAASTKAATQVENSIPQCAICPDGSRCLYERNFTWTGVQQYWDWDPDIEKWISVYIWEECDLIQKCRLCD